jgi:membrane protein YqaA with SNARE-associated domain
MSSVRSARAVRVGTALGVGAVLAAGIGLLAAPRGLQGAVETATGPAGLLIVAVYSFLIAVALPLPSEVVLAAPLDLGLPTPVTLALVIVVSALGKTAGSVAALSLGREIAASGPVLGWLRRSRFDIVAWGERRTVAFARRHGYAGLALALCVPGVPDTLSIYAFAVLGRDVPCFALAAFVGSAGRLLVWLAGVELLVSAL